MGAAVASGGRTIGRYVVFDEIAAGGMATVHLGRMEGAASFRRTVAIKRLHPHLSRDRDFVSMFLDEARIAARIRHPNVVGVLDVVHEGDDLFLVMDYVQGETLARLWRAVRPGRVPSGIAVAAMTGVLHGLHAAHEATDDDGTPLHIVHRDVSPQNVMIGTDGVARVLDFGVAKAMNRVQTTQDGLLKGKIAYMAPEQLLEQPVDRRVDVYAAAVVLHECLTGERLFESESQGATVRKILDATLAPPSSRVPSLPRPLDEVVMRGLERDPRKRWQTAREMAVALERAMTAASMSEIGEWVTHIAGSALGERERRVRELESRSDTRTVPEARAPMKTALMDDVPVQVATVAMAFAPTKPTPAQMKTVALGTVPLTPRAPSSSAPRITPAPSDSSADLDEVVLPRSGARSFVIGIVVVIALAAIAFTTWRALAGRP